MNQTEIQNTNKYFIHILKPTENVDGFSYLNLDNIHTLEESSVSSIYINDLLDYIDSSSIETTLKMIKSKLTNNGKLYIQGTDIKSASISLLYGQISMPIFKSMVYGVGKRSTYTISDIKEILQEIEGIKISSMQYINASQYYIECVRYE